METPPPPDPIRFGDFELDVAAYELRRLGRPVKIGRQAMDVLILLVERRRQLVSRTDIEKRLWGPDVFVDAETGINTAISKVRQALRDSAEAPAFVETVPGKGYRFIAEVALPSPAPNVEAETPAPPPAAASSEAGPPAMPRRRRTGLPLAAAALGIAVAGIGFAVSTWSTETPPVASISLAVLPFENIGSDPDRAYLAAGLTEETSALLAQVDPEHLIVKGRALHYKGSTKTAAEIGAELSVDYLLEGGLRAEGDRLRATATLIRVKDQAHVWSQAFDREVQSLLALQRDLGMAIADHVRLELSPTRAGDLARRQTQNAAAYDAYLRARYLESRRAAATNVQAAQEYQRAVALDPNYALAWAGLSFLYTANTINGDAAPSAMAAPARDAAAHALRTNPELAEAQLAQGYVYWLLDWDWTASETALRHAIRLDPSNAWAHMVLGHVLSQMGRQAEGEAAMRRARELEPLEPMRMALSAQVAYQGRDYQSAVDLARRAVSMDSTLWIGSMQLAQGLEGLGESALALTALTDAARFSGGNSKTYSLRGYILAKGGREAEARAVLRQLEDAAATRYVPPYATALVHAGLGDRNAVFEWLERAYAARDVHLVYLPVDPKWDPYRADPRFAALLARAGFPTRRP
jgi:TolB-like protein/DNA-binding winged helix-turn-helix (wHTH) protein/Flp pilus assembly protein TadD